MPPLLVNDFLQTAAPAGIDAGLHGPGLFPGTQPGIHRRGGDARVVMQPRIGRPGGGGLGLRLLTGGFRRGSRRFRQGIQRAARAGGQEAVRLTVETGDLKALEVLRRGNLLRAGQGHALLQILHGRVFPEHAEGHAALQYHPGGAGGGNAQGQLRRVFRRGDFQDFRQHVFRQLPHHVGIDDERVGFRFVPVIIFVGTDFVVFLGMFPQIHRAIAADPAHAGLEPAGFVFVRHNADAAVFRQLIPHVYRPIAVLFRQNQRHKAKIGFLRIVFFNKADTIFSGQFHRYTPPYKLLL